jgi:hypothetical protein
MTPSQQESTVKLSSMEQQSIQGMSVRNNYMWLFKVLSRAGDVAQ